MQTEFANPYERTAALAEMLRPPRRMPVSLSAREVVRITAVGGYNGAWSPEVAPYITEPMDCLSSRNYEAVVFAGPARTGKTQGLVDCWIGHAVTHDPGDMMLVFPTEILADDYSKRRLRRLHNQSPRIAEYLSKRAHDNSIRTTIYRHGMMLNLAWPTSSQLGQRDIRYMALSDYDSMPDDISGEGEVFGLSKKRVQTFGSAGKTLAESSPKRERIDPKWKPKTRHEAPPTRGGILALYNRGDRRRLYWQCKECGEWFEAPSLPQFDDLGDPESSAKTAHVPCPHCGGVHLPADKRALNLGARWLKDGETIDADGVIHGDGRESVIASFWMLGCAAAFQTWGSLVINELQALREYERTGEEQALITTRNTDQGVPHISKAKESLRTAAELEARAEQWTRGVVPAGVRFLLCLVDVQGTKFVVQVIGYGVKRESWLVDRFDLLWSDRLTPSGEHEPLDPAGHPEDWEALTPLLSKTYPLADESGRSMMIHALGCDSGGKAGVTDRAYGWWRRLKRKGLHRKAWLVKGDPNAKAPRVRKTHPDATKRKDRGSSARGDVPVLMLNTTELKNMVNSDLARNEHGPGYTHLPEWLEGRVFDELVAEVWDGKRWEKVPANARNEAWDLYYYGCGLSLFLGAETIKWKKPPRWAEEWPVNSGVSGTKENHEKPERPISTYRWPSRGKWR